MRTASQLRRLCSSEAEHHAKLLHERCLQRSSATAHSFENERVIVGLVGTFVCFCVWETKVLIMTLFFGGPATSSERVD